MNEILEDIVYALFLIDFEYVDNDKGREVYEGFRKMAVTMEHCGDCTWDSCSCERCSYERMFTEAKQILRILYDRGYTQGGSIFQTKQSIYALKKKKTKVKK